jgi:hypothetical protein
MPSLPTSTPTFASQFAALLVDQGVTLDNATTFATSFSTQLTDWLGGEGAIPAALSQKLATAIGNINIDALQRIEWWTGTITGGPNSDGLYPMTNAAGVTTPFPCLAKILLDVKGLIPKGEKATYAELPASGNSVGDMWNVALDGRSYVWGTGASWIDMGAFRGATGASAGQEFTIAGGNAASDPGNGKIKFNNATPASVTALYVDNLNQGGSDVTAWLDAISLQTTAIRAQLTLRQVGSDKVMTFNVTGAVTNAASYRTIPGAVVGTAPAFDVGARLQLSVGFTPAMLAEAAAATADANTKAGLADTAATNANTKAGLAQTAATAADTARTDLASASATIFAAKDTTVAARDEVVGVYGSNATTGTYPAVDGTNTFASGLTAYPNSPVTVAGNITGVSLFVAEAGAATLVVSSLNGDGTLKLEASKDVTLAIGVNTFEDWYPSVSVGWFVGVYRAVSGPRYATGATTYYTTGLTGAASAKTSASANLRLSYRVETGMLKRMRVEEVASADAVEKITGSTTTFGTYPPGDGSNTLASNITTIPQVASTKAGTVTDVAVHALLAGAATICVVSLNGDGTVKLEASAPVTLAVGANDFSGLTLPIQVGWYVGIHAAASTIRYAGTTPGIYYTTGIPGLATAKSTSTVGAKIAYKVRTGLTLTAAGEAFRAKAAELANSTAIAAETARAGAAETSLQGQITGSTVQQGLYPATDQTFSLADGYTAINGSPISAAGRLSTVSVFVAGAQTGTLCLLTKNGSNQFTLVASKVVTLATGLNALTWSQAVAAGQYLGLYAPGNGVGSNKGVKYASAGGAGLNNYYVSGLPATDSASTALGTNTLLSLGWSFAQGLGTRLTAVEDTQATESGAAAAVAAEITRATNAEAALQAQITGSNVSQGQSPAVHLSFGLADGYTAIPGTPISASGKLASVSVYSSGAQAGKLCLLTKNGANQFTLVASKDVTLINGLNTLAWSYAITAGQYIGVYAAGPGGGGNHGVEYATTGGPGLNNYYLSGVAATNTASSALGTNSLFAIGWTFALGLGTRVTALEDALASPPAPASLTAAGIGLLDAADKTGATDATAVFAAAVAAHPAPYVPPGIFAVTALASGGAGFWGPGKVYVNGVRYPLPARPSKTTLHHKLRSGFGRLAGTGSPLVLIGDSLSAHFTASVLGKHWFNQLEDFLNIDSAPGSEPSTVVVRNDDGTTGETAAFYGLTVSGGSNGTRGPVGKSVILAAGDYIELTGAYSEVDAFYQQQSGAGHILFSYNGGAAYKDVDASGATTLDKYTGPSATGQTASGTYRLTASGGPVEITGILRHAPTLSTGGTPRPIRCMRAAYGGYTGSNFTDARIDSIIAQATSAAGGPNPEYIMAPFTNDMLFGSAPRPATYEGNLNRMIARVQATTPSRVSLLTPPRPRFSSWGSYLTAGQDFDTFLAIAQKVGASTGCPVLSLDTVDFDAEGLFGADHLHWNDAGNDRVFDIFAEWRAQ